MLYDDKYIKKEHWEYVRTEEVMQLVEDAKKSGGCIIYGAGKYAQAVIRSVRSIDIELSILGIAVTKEDENVSILENIRVESITSFADKVNIPIWIATQECWQEEIFNNLKRMGFKKVIAITQLHINKLGEIYLKRQLSEIGIDISILELMNVKRLFRDFWKNRFNNMCDLFGNIKAEMYRKATEQTADFVVNHMMHVKCYENRYLMHKDVYSRIKEGLCLEFGVASGNSINDLADLRKDRIIYGFDSFDGLPEDWNVAATGFEKGSIRQANNPEVRENVRLVVGLFEDSLPVFLNSHNENAAFIHIDCDLYSSTKTVLDNLMKNGRIVSGTEIIFDEYFNYPGWNIEGEYTAFLELTEKYGIAYEYTGFVENGSQVSVKII